MGIYFPESTIGERIRSFAVTKYGSLDAFAQAIGMHPVQLSKYATDKSKPGADVLQRFMAAGMSIDWLLSGQVRWLRETIVLNTPNETVGELTVFLQTLIQHLNSQKVAQPLSTTRKTR